MYQDGEGVPRDRIAAYRWMAILSRWKAEVPPGGMPVFSATQLELDQLAAHMTDEDLAEARRDADAFREVYRLSGLNADLPTQPVSAANTVTASSFCPWPRHWPTPR